MLTQLLNRHPGIIELQEVVKVDIIPAFHGIVYDVQTNSTLCIGNGYIMSNCRCTIIPVMDIRENERVLSGIEHFNGPLLWEGLHPPRCPCEGDYWNDQRI
jgi:hypothetical protein